MDAGYTIHILCLQISNSYTSQNMRENIAKLDTLTLQIYFFLSRTMYYIIIYAYDVIVDFCFKKKEQKRKKEAEWCLPGL